MTPAPCLPQLVRYSTEGLLQLGPLGSTAFLPDSKCLVDDGRARAPTLRKCEDVARPAQRLWDFTQVSGAGWKWGQPGARTSGFHLNPDSPRLGDRHRVTARSRPCSCCLLLGGTPHSYLLQPPNEGFRGWGG